MALELSNTLIHRALSNVFRPTAPTVLYAMIPAVDILEPNAVLPSAQITFDFPANGQIKMAGEGVHLTVPGGTKIDRVYIGTSTLTNSTLSDALLRIELSGDDVEIYDSNGIYIINTINVAINT